jgi:thiamine biosynthesis lipoprotein
VSGEHATLGPPRVVRRARPLLGTLVEVGVRGTAQADRDALLAACTRAFDALETVQRCLTRFTTDSDVGRFNAAPPDDWIDLQADTVVVLQAAAQLQRDSDGAFDITLGSAPEGWTLRGTRLHKHDARARLDLGGIGKGHAVDRAVQALQDSGVASGWVNAGGDLRCFGDDALALQLRDEARGGVVEFGRLRDGAFATSWFGAGARSPLAAAASSSGARRAAHVSVAAASCLWADALTKVVAATGNPHHRALATRSARAWVH